MKTTKPEKLTDFPWLNLFRVLWSNRGSEGEWVFASRKNLPDKEILDGVVVVPIHVRKNHITGDVTKRLVVIKEYRIPIDSLEYGFPSGLKVPGESIHECAKRELQEETGLELTTITRVSPMTYSTSGMCDESVVFVFCECVGDLSAQNLEPNEEITVELIGIEEVSKLMSNYKVKHSMKLWPILLMFHNTKTFDVK